MAFSRKKTTIFRQLLLSVLLPVVVLIAGLSVINFYRQNQQIKESRQENVQNLSEDIGDFLTFFDQAMIQVEKATSGKAREISQYLVDSTFASTDRILTVNLDSLRKTMGAPDMDIYIIDTTGTIRNTTFSDDLGLDFYERSDYYVRHFEGIWQSQKFVEDRISSEVVTMRPKKYTYQSTKDTLYIIELGVYNDNATELIRTFIDQLNRIPEKYDGIEQISLFFGTDEFSSYYQNHQLQKHELRAASRTLNTKRPSVVAKTVDNVQYTSEFKYLKMEGSHLLPGYILRVVHNNVQEQKLVKAAIRDFGRNLLIFVLPIFILILWRARVIVKPISVLVDKTDEIRSGKLEERVSVDSRNEIGDLGEHFNSMVDQLQDSYKNLEHKVDVRTAELKRQKEIVEIKNQEIMDSINYAKRIQAAILPTDLVIRKRLEKSFVVYLPKDVVAGDFYWMETTGDWLLFAAADCTGHGVPGAMVSVVCHNAMNRAVREFGLVEPGKILDKTTDLVIGQFAKSNEEVRDGMDISLCALNTKTGTLLWAGANNRLLIIRAEDTAVIEEIKGDKQPVGKYTDRKPFTSHTVSYRQGDRFYMTTDGYFDQFGGPASKKFKSRNFKNLLVEISGNSLDTQKEILISRFKAWKGDLEQIDDVCVFGFEL